MAVELTVIVKGEDGGLLSNAQVSVAPGGFTATTGENGEAVVTVDGASRYQVTVRAGETEETVPFYVIDSQPTARLEVNLQYLKERNELKTEETQVASETPWYQTTGAYVGYVGLGVLLAIVVIGFVLKRHKKSRRKKRARFDK